MKTFSTSFILRKSHLDHATIALGNLIQNKIHERKCLEECIIGMINNAELNAVKFFGFIDDADLKASHFLEDVCEPYRKSGNSPASMNLSEYSGHP